MIADGQTRASPLGLDADTTAGPRADIWPARWALKRRKVESRNRTVENAG